MTLGQHCGLMFTVTAFVCGNLDISGGGRSCSASLRKSRGSGRLKGKKKWNPRSTSFRGVRITTSIISAELGEYEPCCSAGGYRAQHEYVTVWKRTISGRDGRPILESSAQQPWEGVMMRASMDTAFHPTHHRRPKIARRPSRLAKGSQYPGPETQACLLFLSFRTCRVRSEISTICRAEE